METTKLNPQITKKEFEMPIKFNEVKSTTQSNQFSNDPAGGFIRDLNSTKTTDNSIE
jgi:hypothetical protein